MASKVDKASKKAFWDHKHHGPDFYNHREQKTHYADVITADNTPDDIAEDGTLEGDCYPYYVLSITPRFGSYSLYFYYIPTQQPLTYYLPFTPTSPYSTLTPPLHEILKPH